MGKNVKIGGSINSINIICLHLIYTHVKEKLIF